MNLFKTSVLSGISNLVKMATSFLTGKIIAIYIGPSGLAFLGQFQNFINIAMSFSNAGINSGVTKYVSEFYEQEDKKDKYISTSFFITIFSSIIMSLLIFVFNETLANYLLNDIKYSYVFKIFSISLVFFSFNNLLTSILNGSKEIKKLIIINILSTIVGAIFTSLLIYYYKVDGALISLVTYQSISLIITILFVLKSDWFKLSKFFKDYDKESANNLFKFSLMALISVVILNISQLLIRNFIISSISFEQAGYWQAMIRISDLYLNFIITTLSVYYLPKLSEIKDDVLLRKEIINGYKLILPVLFVINFLIYECRYIIINLVFTERFIPMSDLFLFQMVGDFFKISSWLLSFLMIAKAMTKLFIFTEIIFSFSFILLCVIFLKYFSLTGLAYAHALNYIIYTLTMMYVFRKVLFLKV